MRAVRVGGLVLASLLSFWLASCNNGASTDLSYKAAIDDYFRAVPSCIWTEPKKFPAQAATSDDAETEGYDALTEEGLLVRTTAEKKIVIVSKQVNNYDLSDKGRASWTADPTQPGYGNFCYGNRTVTSIDYSRVGSNASGVRPSWSRTTTPSRTLPIGPGRKR